MRTKPFVSTAGALALAFAMWITPGSLKGQAMYDRINVNLPYTVMVGEKTLPPGDYVIQRLPDSGGSRVLLFYSDNGMKYHVIRRNYVVTHATRRLSAPDGKAKPSGPNLKVREKIHGERLIDNKWVLTVDGHYIAANRLSPRITVRS